jgi:hypothetical protein
MTNHTTDEFFMSRQIIPLASDLQPRRESFKPLSMRLLISLLFLGFILSEIRAQSPSPSPSPSPTPLTEALLLAELDRRRPDEISPFFANRETEAFLSSAAGRRLTDQEGLATYPNTAAYDSADRIFGKFFRGLSRSVRFGPEKPSSMLSLKVDPSTDFPLAERREISATLTITNYDRKLLRLFFSTTQRFDFIITDPSGKEIERWSNDRAFQTTEGVVMINPNEKVQYSTFIPTRDMQAGQTYTLRAELADNPEFATSTSLNPR